MRSSYLPIYLGRVYKVVLGPERLLCPRGDRHLTFVSLSFRFSPAHTHDGEDCEREGWHSCRTYGSRGAEGDQLGYCTGMPQCMPLIFHCVPTTRPTTLVLI